MKTEVEMKRKLFGEEITQKSKSEMFSATDLVKAGNKWRISNNMEPFKLSAWFQQKGVKEFMEELENQYGVIKIAARGRGKHTWIHPLLFIDLGLAISPKLKIEVYEWLYDNLLLYRNNSGDSYKKMCGSLWVHTKNKALFPREVTRIANMIRNACAVDDWNSASQDQLSKRDKIHNNIALLSNVLSSNDEAVRLGILEEKT